MTIDEIRKAHPGELRDFLRFTLGPVVDPKVFFVVERLCQIAIEQAEAIARIASANPGRPFASPSSPEILSMNPQELVAILIDARDKLSGEQISMVLLNLLGRLTLVEGQVLGLITKIHGESVGGVDNVENLDRVSIDRAVANLSASLKPGPGRDG